MKVSARQLEVFITVVQNNNVTRASEVLFLSQSAVSMALSELEKQLGEVLFDRVGKRLVLNESGRALLPKAIEVISRIKEIQVMFTKKDKELAGELKVGASSTIGNYALPKILGQYVTEHQKVKVSLKIDNTEEIISDIIHFNLDFAIVEGLTHRRELDAIAWKKDEMVVVASPSHPLAKKSKITQKELAEQNWILREAGSGSREFFENMVTGKLETVNVFLELGNTEAIKHTVQDGVGLTCLSRSAVNKSLERGALVVLDTPFFNLERYFHMITHKEKYKTDILKSFIQTCDSLTDVEYNY